MGGLVLILIGMAVMLVAPLQRVSAHRRERPPAAMILRTTAPPVAKDGFGSDPIDRIR